MVIAATGQKPDLSFLTGKDKTGMTTGWGNHQDRFRQLQHARNENFLPAVTASAVRATLIEALNMGNKAAKSIDAYLQGKTFSDELSFEGVVYRAAKRHGVGTESQGKCRNIPGRRSASEGICRG